MTLNKLFAVVCVSFFSGYTGVHGNAPNWVEFILFHRIKFEGADVNCDLQCSRVDMAN